MQLWKLGCRWGGGTPLFYDFIKENDIVIGWVDKDYQIGDWLLITNGHTVLSLAKVISQRKSVLEFPQWETLVKNLEIPFEKNLYIYSAKFLNLTEPDRFNYPLQRGIVKVQGDEYIQTFKNLRNKYMAQENLTNSLNLLRYKKQIILQGPPGTGKTKLAKELATTLIATNSPMLVKPYSIGADDIIKYIKAGEIISSVKGRTTYTIKAINTSNIVISTEKNTEYAPSFVGIIDFYKNNKWSKGAQENGLDPYEAAIAKNIYDKIVPVKSADNIEPLKLIQFHPSYTYEDFVRGIVAEPHGDGISYTNVNKMLGKLAKAADENYHLSKQDNLYVQQDKWIEEAFEAFKESIENKIEKEEFNLSGDIGIYKVETDCFRYGRGWAAPARLNFVDLKKLIKAALNGDLDSTENAISKDLSVHAHYRYTYYLALLRVFLAEYSFEKTNEKQPLNNFVLIIDEINRANLSSVFGELIYALEYRGESVESMYSIDGNNQLVLPPNLYIIGTMNTADRSVGHIDYAMRRRFAFVDVLPKDLSAELGNRFHKLLFEEVKNLFANHLSPEFDLKDVQLGHSYFIDKTAEGGAMPIRLQYEIKPILMEYVKDGILTGTDIIQKITNLSI